MKPWFNPNVYLDEVWDKSSGHQGLAQALFQYFCATEADDFKTAIAGNDEARKREATAAFKKCFFSPVNGYFVSGLAGYGAAAFLDAANYRLAKDGWPTAQLVMLNEPANVGLFSVNSLHNTSYPAMNFMVAAVFYGEYSPCTSMMQQTIVPVEKIAMAYVSGAHHRQNFPAQLPVGLETGLSATISMGSTKYAETVIAQLTHLFGVTSIEVMANPDRGLQHDRWFTLEAQSAGETTMLAGAFYTK